MLADEVDLILGRKEGVHPVSSPVGSYEGVQRHISVCSKALLGGETNFHWLCLAPQDPCPVM